MTFKKICGLLHLWLGMASGIVIVVLGITGCILAFEREIRTITDREQFVATQNKPYLPPSVLKENASKALNGKKLNGIDYPGKDKAAMGFYYDQDSYFIVALDPYDGKAAGVKNMNRDFFRIVLNAHYYLLLPPAVGQPIVASATLIFVVMMITGLILWWPKNKAARKQRFRIKWNAKWRRINYDLHNVLGFYMTWVAIIIAVTGLVWGFEWVARFVYRVSSGGTPLVEEVRPLSDTTIGYESFTNPMDRLWNKHFKSIEENESISVSFPKEKSDPLEITINHRPGTYYHTESFLYDQYTGAQLAETGSASAKFEHISFADKLKRMNYDIHVGAVLGLPGKILAFFASLIAASLPVTGFYIWWGRRKKTKKAAPRRASIRKSELAG
jgi:uncharacterized iron-regulated membrane protein